MKDIQPQDLDRIIEMAWEDRTTFEAIHYQFGMAEQEVIALMRTHMKHSLLQDVAQKGVRAQNKTWSHVRIQPIQSQVPPLNKAPLQTTHQCRQQCLLSM